MIKLEQGSGKGLYILLGVIIFSVMVGIGNWFFGDASTSIFDSQVDKTSEKIAADKEADALKESLAEVWSDEVAIAASIEKENWFKDRNDKYAEESVESSIESISESSSVVEESSSEVVVPEEPEEPEVPEVKIPSVNYQAHVQDYFWLAEVKDGKLSGTLGEARRLEAIKVSLSNLPVQGGVEYQAHVQDYGWMDKVSNGEQAGTTKLEKRMEAIRMNLTGELATQYDIYYRVHAQNFGWLGWTKNGETAGTSGYGYRLEALEIRLVKKGDDYPSSNEPSNMVYALNGPLYTTTVGTTIAKNTSFNLHDIVGGATNFVKTTEKVSYNSNGGDWIGLYLPNTMFKANTKYSIEFDMTKTSGSINYLGGHQRIFKYAEVYIDGELVNGDWNFGTIVYPNDGLKHHVKLVFVTNTITAVDDLNVYLQPNREHFGVSYGVEFKNLLVNLY